MDLWLSSMISLKSCISLISRTRFECNHRMDLWYLWHLLFFLSRDIDIVSAVSQSALSKLRLPCSYCAISSCLRLLDIDNVSCLRFTVHPRDHVYFLHVSLSSLSFKMRFFLFLEQKIRCGVSLCVPWWQWQGPRPESTQTLSTLASWAEEHQVCD